MTISTTQMRVSYAGDGVSVNFPIPFEFFLNTDIAAVVTTSAGAQAQQVYGADFLLTGAGTPAGGTFNKTVALPVGYTLSIYLDPPLTQGSQYPNNGMFPSATVENDFDRQTQIGQRLADRISRALRFPDGDVASASTLLPPAAQRANTNLGFDGAGNASLFTTLAAGVLSAASIGAFITPAIGAEAGHVASSWYEYGDPMRYGAVGDGVADDSLPVLYATLVGNVKLKLGRTFLVSTVVPTNSVRFEGLGTIKQSANPGVSMISFPAATPNLSCELIGCTLDGNGAAQGANPTNFSVDFRSAGAATPTTFRASGCNFLNAAVGDIRVFSNLTGGVIVADITRNNFLGGVQGDAGGAFVPRCVDIADAVDLTYAFNFHDLLAAPNRGKAGLVTYYNQGETIDSSYTAAIAGTVMTVSGFAGGPAIAAGHLISGTVAGTGLGNIIPGTIATSLGSSTGGNGTVNVLPSQNVAAVAATSVLSANLVRTRVIGNYFNRMGRDQANGQGCIDIYGYTANVLIEGNVCRNWACRAIAFKGSSPRVTVSANAVDTTYPGLVNTGNTGIAGNAATINDVFPDVAVVDNHVTGCSGDGIFVNGLNNAGQGTRGGVRVAGNNCRYNGTSGSGRDINLQAIQDPAVFDNYLAFCQGQAAIGFNNCIGTLRLHRNHIYKPLNRGILSNLGDGNSGLSIDAIGNTIDSPANLVGCAANLSNVASVNWDASNQLLNMPNATPIFRDQSASITASITAGGVLNVSAIANNADVVIGHFLTAPGALTQLSVAAVQVASQLSGVPGATGTYQLAPVPGNIASQNFLLQGDGPGTRPGISGIVIHSNALGQATLAEEMHTLDTFNLQAAGNCVQLLGLRNGQRCTLYPANAARLVTLKANGGNLANGNLNIPADFTFAASLTSSITLQRCGSEIRRVA